VGGAEGAESWDRSAPAPVAPCCVISETSEFKQDDCVDLPWANSMSAIAFPPVL